LVTGEAALPFLHMETDAHFAASVFSTRRSGAMGGEQAMIEYLQAEGKGAIRDYWRRTGDAAHFRDRAGVPGQAGATPAWGGWRCCGRDPDSYLFDIEQP
jgi:hypothetical protein